MLRQDSSRSDPERDERKRSEPQPQNRAGNIDIQRELNRLEEMILQRPRIPFTRRTIVDEEQLLDQLDLVRVNLPKAFSEALEILCQQDEILQRAENYAQEIIETAQRRAAQTIDEMDVVRQAELKASQIQQRVQQECEAMQKATLSEIEQMRHSAQEELEQMRQMALAESKEIQNGADDYADGVLTGIEQQLTDMLRVIRNGRQQLQNDAEVRRSPQRESPGASGARSLPVSRKKN